jgi:hypothetical protein
MSKGSGRRKSYPPSDSTSPLPREGRGQHRVPLSTALDVSISERARDYARSRGIALARLLEQALLEYLDARAANDSVGPLARTYRRSGRPSHAEQIEEHKRTELLRKKSGRPLSMLRLLKTGSNFPGYIRKRGSTDKDRV